MKGILLLGIFLMVGLVSAEFVYSAGLDIQESFVVIGENLTYGYIVFDEYGVMITADCDWELWTDGLLNATGSDLVNTELGVGFSTLNIYCEAEVNGTMNGGYKSVDIEKNHKTLGGLEWKEPDNWTFPVIYLVITIIVLILAFTYTSSIIGVFGSLMLMFSYFLIGATSPLLFAPLLIIGLLLAFKFGTM